MSEESKKLMNLLMRLEGLLRRQMMGGRQRAVMNPHRGQGRVLSILRMKKEITQKELTYILDMSKQAIGELLSKLEHCGYITRTPSEEDGRVMIVTLTEKGRTVSDEMDLDGDESENLFQCLTREEQKNLGEYLERLITSWQNDGALDRRHMGQRRGGDYRDRVFEGDIENRFGFEHFPGTGPFRR